MSKAHSELGSGAVSNQQKGGIQFEFEAEQGRERVHGERGLDMARPKIDNSAYLLSLGDGQGAKISIVSEDNPVVRPRMVQKSAVTRSCQSRFLDIEYVAGMVA